MRKLLLLLTICVYACALSAQYTFPNFSFENWTSGEPDSWNTNNAPGYTIPVTKTTDAHSGNFAVRGDVTSFDAGTAPNLGSNGGSLFEFTQQYPTLNFYYKFNKVNTDFMIVSADLYDSTNYPVGTIYTKITNAASTYTPIAIPFTYLNARTPARMAMLIVITDSVHVSPGSYFIVDDFSLGGFTSVGIRETDNAEENVTVFSNPAIHSISFSVAEENPSNSISVLDMSGRQVIKTFVSRSSRIEIPAAELADGIYFLNIQSEKGLRMKKVVVRHP